MRLVVKIGGDAAEQQEARHKLAGQIARLGRSGCEMAVVHGGGKTLTRVLARMGIATKFSGGLRVTDAETRDVALMVLAGLVNKQWAAEITAKGSAAIGLCGGDGGLMEALPAENPELGFVGKPGAVNPAILHMAFEQNLIPVIASLAPGPGGEYFNINADDFAAATAKALGADRLIYMTESGGVWDAQKRLLPRVRAAEIESLIEQGVVRDGMIPKLRSCARVLEGGVGEIDIISSSAPGGLLKALENKPKAGTRIVR